MPSDSTRGVRSLVLTALSFSTMSLLARLLGPRMPSVEIVFARSVVTLILTLALVRRIRLADWRGKHRVLLVMRGLVGVSALICFFYAVTHLPLAEATVIQFTNPIFTAVLASFYLGERATARLYGAIALGLTGMLLITRPAVLFGGAASSLPTVAVLVGLAGAVLTSGAHVLVRRLAADEHELVIVLYFPLIAVPASLAMSVPVWVWPEPRDWLPLIGVGVVAQIGQIHLTRGMKHIKAASAGVILYSQIIFATLWGLAILGERPDAWTLSGSLLVLGGTVVAARRPRVPA